MRVVEQIETTMQLQQQVPEPVRQADLRGYSFFEAAATEILERIANDEMVDHTVDELR